MDWLWNLLFLMAVVRSAQAQIQLVQSGPELKKPGESVKISCKASGYTFTDYTMYWVKQAPGKGLQFMGWINTQTGKPTYAADFKARFVFSLETSASTAFLQINNLKNEDTATYFCRIGSITGNYFDNWGQGVMVTVSSAPDKEPDMFLFSECRAPNQNEHVKLGCMAIGVQPLTLTWEPTFPSIVFSVTNKNYYITILQVSVPASDLNLNHICTITNTSKKKSKKFTLPETWNSQSSQKATPTPQAENHFTEATKPTTTKNIVGATAPSNLNVNILTTSTHHEMSSWLMCEVSGFYPDDIHLWWLSAQSKMDPMTFATAQPIRQSGDKFQTWSVLRLPVALSPSLDTYTCMVEHEASQTKLNASKSLEISGMVDTIPNSCIRDEQTDSYVDLEEENGLWPTLCTFVALFLLTLLYSGFVTFIKVK